MVAACRSPRETRCYTSRDSMNPSETKRRKSNPMFHMSPFSNYTEAPRQDRAKGHGPFSLLKLEEGFLRAIGFRGRGRGQGRRHHSLSDPSEWVISPRHRARRRSASKVHPRPRQTLCLAWVTPANTTGCQEIVEFRKLRLPKSSDSYDGITEKPASEFASSCPDHSERIVEVLTMALNWSRPGQVPHRRLGDLSKLSRKQC